MINLNGHLLHPGAPEISLLNRSFLFGDGLYESIRIFDGTPLFFADHYRRLEKGMKLLGFTLNSDEFKEVLREELKKSLQANGIDQHGRVKIHIFRSGTGAYKPLDNQPYFLMEAYSLKDDYFDFRNPRTVRIMDYKEIPLAFGLLSGLRTASALPYVMAAQYAQAHQVDDVVLYSAKGYIAETSQANIFAIRKKHIYTPSLHTGCINGILRNQVIRLCDRLKLPLTERKFSTSFLRRSEEVFLVDTLSGISQVAQYNKHSYPIQSATLVPFLRKCLYEFLQTQLGDKA